MKNKLWLLPVLLLTFAACDKDDDDDVMMKDLNINITGLKDLGANHVYEGWMIVNGNPVTTGTFTVNSSGQLSKTTFSVNQSQLQSATEFVLTIEPKPDNDPAPSGIKLLAGTFSGNAAAVSVGHSGAFGNSFASASGTYILATPTNGMMTNENSGVWFVQPTMPPTPALTLPALPSTWKYEGWAVINGKPLTTGKFSMATMPDEAAPFSGPMPGPPLPGEDFLENAPTGYTFPLDLSSQEIVITIEPNPDNSMEPFMLKPLAGAVPAGAMDHTSYPLENKSATMPIGTVSR